jgi:hypothetical protein
MWRFKWPNVISRDYQNHLLFFLHIPKTAGTSFRYGAEEYFGKKYVAYDYGANSLVTSDIVKKYFYREIPDPWSFLTECRKQRIRMVGGHVNTNKFVSLANIGRTVTFVRDPLQQIASEFAHSLRHLNYCGTFRDFYTQSNRQNPLSRYIGSLDIEAFGFVGLTERYWDSLQLLNDIYGYKIPHREDNRSRSEKIVKYEFNQEEEKELIQLNQKDIALHRKCKELLETRLYNFQQAKPFAHAAIKEVTEKIVSGWAWWAVKDIKPVVIELLVNGQVVATTQAVELRTGLCYLRPSRGGYVGFTFVTTLQLGDQVQCRVEKTGQYFPKEPLHVQS